MDMRAADVLFVVLLLATDLDRSFSGELKRRPIGFYEEAFRRVGDCCPADYDALLSTLIVGLWRIVGEPALDHDRLRHVSVWREQHDPLPDRRWRPLVDVACLLRTMTSAGSMP